VVLGASAGESAIMDVRRFYFGQYDLLGTTMGSSRDFTSLLNLLAERRIPPPPIDRTFALDDAAQAHAHLESSSGFGKTVLEHP
jgi:NADPH:quinone reductase-like Zn-dependent oxidoreductase